jgi:hypothetical protein
MAIIVSGLSQGNNLVMKVFSLKYSATHYSADRFDLIKQMGQPSL